MTRLAVLLLMGVLAPAAFAGPEKMTIAGEPVDDPRRFEGLFADLPSAKEPPPGTAGVDIVVHDEEGGVEHLRYFPFENILRRSGEWHAVPSELADRIEEELEARAAQERSAWPGYLALFTLLGAGGALVWLKWGRRRSPARAT